MCVRPSSLTILPEGDEKNDDLEQPTVKRFSNFGKRPRAADKCNFLWPEPFDAESIGIVGQAEVRKQKS